MEIEILDTLTKEQERQIKELNEICNKEDGLTSKAYLSTELNFDKRIPAFYLGYVEGKLAAFLTLFMPEKFEAEITAFTHPSYRRKGYFSQLYREASCVCRKNGFKRLLLVTDEKSSVGKEVLRHMEGVRHCFSEYRMELRTEAVRPEMGSVRFEEIAEKAKEIYHFLALQALEMEGECDEFWQAAIHNPLRQCYIQYWETVPVGMFHLNAEEGETCIYGVGILPEYRGRGLGDMMIKYAAYQAAQFAQPVVIEVDSENERAYHLYRKNGFEVVQQTNYFSAAWI